MRDSDWGPRVFRGFEGAGDGGDKAGEPRLSHHGSIPSHAMPAYVMPYVWRGPPVFACGPPDSSAWDPLVGRLGLGVDRPSPSRLMLT